MPRIGPTTRDRLMEAGLPAEGAEPTPGERVRLTSSQRESLIAHYGDLDDAARAALERAAGQRPGMPTAPSPTMAKSAPWRPTR